MSLLLLISEDEDDRIFAGLIAEKLNLPFQHTTSPDEGSRIIRDQEVSIIFVEATTEQQYQAFEDAVIGNVGMFSERVNANILYFLSSASLDRSGHLIRSSLFGHFVLKSYRDMKKSAEFYGRVVEATLADRGFGLARFLNAKCKIQKIHLKNSSDKIKAVDAIKAFLIAAKFQTRMASLIANAADELIMNAIFDAPADDLGKPIFSLTSRNTSISLEGKSAVELDIGFDGQYVGISAIDLYGSLDRARLIRHIAKAYIKDEYQVKTNTTGAGIGLATVFRSGGSFLFMSESRVRTEVIVFFS